MAWNTAEYYDKAYMMRYSICLEIAYALYFVDYSLFILKADTVSKKKNYCAKKHVVLN